MHAAFLLIFVAVTALRIAILLTSQAHVDGDEGVVGIMAKHVLEQAARPIFYYGQHYAGGAAIEAYLAAVSFFWFGVSVVSLKSVALLLSLATLPLTYAFCVRHFDRRVALMAVTILATATPLIEWHTKVRGGYAAIPVLVIAIFYSYSRIVYDDRKEIWRPFVLGLLCGLAYYNQELLLPLLLVLAAVGLFRHRDALSGKGLALLCLGGSIGASPMLYYNFAYDFENLRHILGSTRPTGALAHLSRLPFEVLPRFFVGANPDSLVAQAPPRAYVEYAIYAGLSIGLALERIGGGRRAPMPSIRRPDLVALLLIFTLVHILAYTMSRGAGVSSRYLLPLYPSLAILAAIAIARLLAMGARGWHWLGGVLLLVLLCTGGWNHVQYVGPARVRISVWTGPQEFANRETSGAAIPVIVDLLRRAGVSHVRTTHFIQWRLVFESDEQLIASSSKHLPGGNVYPPYDLEVARAEAAGEPVAYVFHRESQHLSLPAIVVIRARVRSEIDLGSWLEQQGHRRVEVEEFVVFIPPARR